MRKTLTCFLLVALMTGSMAQTSLLDSGILPGNPFYGFKTLFEDMGTFFTFGEVAKAKRYSELSEIRLAEVQALVNQSEFELANQTINRYREHMNRSLQIAEQARKKGLDTDEVMGLVANATLKHQLVLADVYEKVPEQAKSGIERAMQESMKGYENALNGTSSDARNNITSGMEKMKQEVEDRFGDLKQQGAQTPEIPDIPVSPGAPENGQPGGKP